MSKKMYEESYINESALVIQKKLGKSDKFKLENFPELIDKIGEPPMKDFNFYDWDGKRLYSFTTEEAHALTSLPDLPDHSDINLVSQEWNWTLDEIKNYPFGDIGLYVEHIDTYTHVFVNTLMDNAQPYIHLKTEGGDTKIDWGDGSEETTVSASSSNQSIQHTYTTLGDYEIIVKPQTGATVSIGNTSGDYIFYGDHNSTQYYRFGLNKVYVGRNCNIVQDSFYYCRRLTAIAISKYAGLSSYNSAFMHCRSLVGITMPKTMGDSRRWRMFASCNSLSYVAFSPSYPTNGETSETISNAKIKQVIYYHPIGYSSRDSNSSLYNLDRIFLLNNSYYISFSNIASSDMVLKELYMIDLHNIMVFNTTYLLKKYINKIYIASSLVDSFNDIYPDYDGEVIPVVREWESTTEFIFDQSEVEDGYKLNTSTGELVENSSSSVSGFIPVDSNEQYYYLLSKDIAYTDNVIYYDENKDFVSYPGDQSFLHYGSTTSTEEFGCKKATRAVPDNVKFIRFSAATSQIRNCSIWKRTN